MKKALLIGGGILILIFWGHAVFGLLLHVVFIVLEVLELLVDTILEHAGLNLYEAQMVTAWLGLGAFSLLLIVALKKLNAAMQKWRIEAPVWWEEEKARLRAMRSSMRWPVAIVVLMAFLIVAVFL